MTDPTAGNSFNAYVAEQYNYDTNLYRLPDYSIDIAKLVGPHAARQDHLNTISAGADGLWTFSRHVVAVDLRADRNTFSHNTDLNNVGGDGKLTWDWQAGPVLMGRAGAEYSRALSSFANTILTFVKDDVDSKQYFGSVQLRTGLHWNLLSGLKATDTAHSSPALKYEELRAKSGNFGIQYVSLENNTVSWVYEYIRGTFPRSLVNHDFKDQTGSVKVDYKFGAATVLDGSVGYLKHDTAGRTSNFAGNIWDVTLAWQPAAKTSIGFAVWRRLAAFAEAQANYFVARGYSISPAWQATERIKLAVIASWDNRDFLNSNPLVVQTVERRDRVDSQQLSLTYTPRDALSLALTYRFEKRDSNVSEFQYSDDLATAMLKIMF